MYSMQLKNSLQIFDRQIIITCKKFYWSFLGYCMKCEIMAEKRKKSMGFK